MRFALASAIALSAALVAACNDDASVRHSKGQPACTSDDCRPLKAEPPSLTIENRTGAFVELRVSDADSLLVDRRVIEGTLALPIPSRTAGEERRVPLVVDGSASFSGQIEIAGGPQRLETMGAIVRVGDGPAFLAVGPGKAFVRLADDGTPLLEAEDPKLLSLVPSDRSAKECAAGALAEPFFPPPIQLYDAMPGTTGTIRVRYVARDAEGCREITIGDDRESAIANVRVCIPDDAYPFGEELVKVFVGGDPGTSASFRFHSVNGSELVLSRVVFGERTSTTVPGLELAFDPDDDCARIHPRCGHVDVPAKITARTEDGITHAVVFGEPFQSTDEPTRFFVLAASARPVANMACADDGDPGARFWPGRAWVASVKRAAP